MMEPWQEGRPEPGEWLGTRFVCRVSGAPADTVDELRAQATLDRLARLHQVDAELAERREPLSQLLFHAIGAAGGDKPLRNRLITLKRELYNLRPGASAKVTDEVLASLPADDAEQVRAFAGLLDERVTLEAAVRQAYGEETPELRARFRRLLDDADFRKGLMISSRALYGAVDRWGQAAAEGKAELGGKEEKTERGLLRYYTRMAMKATPFSTFCAIIPGEFVENGDAADGELIRFHGDPRQKRSYVRINKFIYGLLYDHLRTRKPVRRALQVELNPTLREENGRLVYLTAIEAREVFQRLANNEVLELITSRFQGMGKPTLGDLIGALCQDPQIEATPEEAEAYLDKLIEIGFLRFHTGIREQDSDWDLPFRALLDAIDDDHARQSSQLLARLREVVEAYTDAGIGERARMIEEMHTLLKDAIESMDVQQRLRRDMPFFEDATSPARAEVALTPAVRRTFETWAEWVRLTSRVAWPRGEQATMRHFFDTFYPASDGPRRVPLLVFYEDFYREHFKAHVEKEGKVRAGVQDDDLKGYDVGNPFGLEFVKRLSEARDALGELVRTRWQAEPGADEISLAAGDVAEALQGVENTSDVCRSMGSFACLAPAEQPGGDPLLVLGGGSYTTGFGKYFSRFLYMLPDEVQEQVRRENASVTGELLAEICGDAQFNANLHPPLLRWEISYPTGESGNADEQLRSSDIFVEPDAADPGLLRLVHGPTGHRVIPVDLGFLNPRMRPPLYQLVSRFTPPAMFGPPIPESPDRRPRPQPAAEQSAKAEGDDPQPDPQAAAEKSAEAKGDDPQPDPQVVAEKSAKAEGDDPQPDPQVVAEKAAEAKGDDPQPDPQVAGEKPAEAKGDDPQPDPQAAPAAERPAPKIQLRPRVTYEGSLVLARKRWMVPSALFPQREPHESAADFFVRANRWRAEAGIPETVYVRINPLPDPPQPKPGQQPADEQAQADAEAQQQAVAAAEVPGYDAPAGEHADEHDEGEAEAAAGEAPAEGGEGGEDAKKEAAKPRTAGSRDLHKPQFIDFGNPLLVGLLGKMGANLKSYHATFEERLPDRAALPRHGGDAYASEIVVQLYFPAGTSGAAAHALTAGGEHAAAVA
ncbi:MAG TPA: lantibiotic dehydratase [Longimicrobium sp.]|nr:lantibiotic dehydratase [Longimicrobium sp.]